MSSGRAASTPLAFLALAALMLASLAGAPPAGAGAVTAAREAASGRVDRVLVVSLPRLTWADLQQGAPPALGRLLERAAVGSLSPRTIGPTTTLGEGYASIGAGNRATLATRRALQLQPWIPDGDSGLAFGVDESFSGEPASAVFERRTGAGAGSARVVHVGMPALTAANDALLYGAEPGSLGAALAGAGRTAAVVANADLGESAGGPVVLQREAALAVVDRAGRTFGRVDTGLLASDEALPFGRGLDADRVVDEARRALDDHDVVLVEASDLERADAFRAVAAPEEALAASRDALRRFDAVLDGILSGVDLEHDLVIVVSPAPPRGRTELLVAAMAGPGVEPGLLQSATTRRAGYITLPDVAPTVLDALGVEAPTAMTGGLMSSAGGAPLDAAAVDRFVDDNEASIFRDAVTGPVTAVFIVFQLLVYALAAVAFSRHRRSLLHLAGTLSLMVLAFPPAAFLSGLLPYHRLSAVGYLLALFGAAAALAGVALLAQRIDPQAPPLLLLCISLAILLGDVVSGGSLQLNTVFGYSPIVAGRFAGFGNLASAMVTVTAVLVVTGVWGLLTRRRGAPLPTTQVLAGGGLVFAVAVVVTGHPGFGSDVGGVLANVPTFTTALLLIAGIAIGWRRSLAIGVGTIAALAAFAAIDLSRPAEVRSHLGRLVSRTLDGGAGGLLVTLERKAAANVSILTSSIWTYAIPITLAFLAFLVWRPQGFLRSVVERFPGVRAGLIAALVGGILGFALNDSGVAIPAMMLGVLLPYLAWLVARTTPAAARAGGTQRGTARGAGT